MTLGKDVFVALAALAWVDGEVAPEEAEALMGAAMMTGLSESDLTEVEAALASPVPLERLDALKITGDDRLFVYGVGLWLVRADGVVTADESDAMTRLARALKLRPEERLLAAASAAGLSSFDEEEDAMPRSVASVAKQLVAQPGDKPVSVRAMKAAQAR